MRLKEYGDFNKSTWFLFPLIIHPDPKLTRVQYLIDSCLINTFINVMQKKIFVMYKNTVQVVDIEPMLQTNYLVDVEEHTTFSLYIYQLLEPEHPKDITNIPEMDDYIKSLEQYHKDLEVFHLFIEGKYSKLAEDYKLKIGKFFLFNKDSHVIKVMRRDEFMYQTIHKFLGCSAKECTCKISTYMVDVEDDNGKLVKREKCSKNQPYLRCPAFKKFEMPNKEEIQLDEKPDLTKEQYDPC